MERFITRKRKENDDKPTVDSSDNVKNSNQSTKKQKTTGHYCDSYLDLPGVVMNHIHIRNVLYVMKSWQINQWYQTK